ncbi:MAG: molybdopterin molybdotransferase MoeA, partial [bacterium]
MSAQEHSCTPTLSGLTGYDEALALMLAHVQIIERTEQLPLADALGHVLAEDVLSLINVPGWDNSAMDGYAIRAEDVPEAGVALKVSQRIPAGYSPAPLAPGTAARIFTGAPVPDGADTVVIQEHCTASDENVRFDQSVSMGGNIRRAGEDIREGAVVVAAGTRLQPQHLGLVASVGVADVQVYSRLKVAVFASGDELTMPGEPLEPGKIYNSNLFTVSALLEALGCEVISLGSVEDTFAATKAALSTAAQQADMIIASGGVSVGEEDHVKPAVEALGTLDMWKVAVRPGKPVAFGHIEGVPFFGSPGNPVSLFVTFVLFCRAIILKRSGVSDTTVGRFTVTADFDWPRPDKRREFHR